MPGWSVKSTCKKVGNNIAVQIVQNFDFADDGLIVRYGRNGIVAECQLYQGPLCVAKGTSILGKEQALKNAHRNHYKKHNRSSCV